MAERYYFDHNATTPVADEVFAAMVACLRETFGNASSIHGFGQDARALVEKARAQVGALLGCSANDIVFTSGGTESDNLAILGSLRGKSGARHLITTTIEHPAVLNVAQQLEREGVDVTWLAVGADGVVSPDDVRGALRPETLMISIMAANNELGTLQPIDAIGAIAREAGVLFHTDGVQAAGKIPLDVEALGLDFLALSAHKLYGPKGVGALYIRKGRDVEPIQYGGTHERRRRPGTENVPGIVGLGAAAKLALGTLPEESARLSGLRDRLQQGALERIPGCWANAGGSPRTPNTANLGFEGVEGEALVIALDLKGFAVSSGAACSSGAIEPSHVLTAIGLSRERAKSCLRFSLGKKTTAEQVDRLLETLAAVVERLRKLAPATPSHA
ncbi:MAG: aminotransferase class V-fold PLP-dependent enzyme [Acidobacteria bacterium]|nr:aminotransferase class V-fold PLP-dependent enzyme [Acidobacteriota bacterium]